MKIHEKIDYAYPLLIFSLAALAFALERLLTVNTFVSVAFAAIAMSLGLSVTVVALAHYWRHG